MLSISKITRKTLGFSSLLIILPLFIFAVACSSNNKEENGVSEGLEGVIEIDGSSTVYPITEAVAEEYRKKEKDVQVNVAVSGTGGGFKRFCPGETDISNASRPIRKNEQQVCEANGVEYVDVTVALDGLSVLVSPKNDFVDCLTIEELNNIWKPESTINNWKDVRVGFPDKKLVLYGPDTDSGTFDYFTDEVNGDQGVSRSDYTASADDNVLVTGISGSAGSLGYFGYAYYVENTDKLKAVGIDAGNGCVIPSNETVAGGAYPLARPIFLYIDPAKLNKYEHVSDFVEFYMDNVAELSEEVGYIALPSYADQIAKINAAKL